MRPPGRASRSSSGSNRPYFLVRSSRPRSHLRTSMRIFGSGPFAKSTRVLYSLNAFKARAELLLDSGINTGHRQAIHTYSAMLRSSPKAPRSLHPTVLSKLGGLVNVWAGPASPISVAVLRRVIKSSRSRCRRIASIPPPQADRKCDQAELRGFRKSDRDRLPRRSEVPKLTLFHPWAVLDRSLHERWSSTLQMICFRTRKSRRRVPPLRGPPPFPGFDLRSRRVLSSNARSTAIALGFVLVPTLGGSCF